MDAEHLQVVLNVRFRHSELFEPALTRWKILHENPWMGTRAGPKPPRRPRMRGGE